MCCFDKIIDHTTRLHNISLLLELIIDACVARAVLSQGGPCDAAEHLDMCQILQRHRSDVHIFCWSLSADCSDFSVKK